MGQKTSYTEVKSQQIEHYEPKDSQIITGIDLNEFDNCIEGLIPDKIPDDMKKSIFNKIKICKYCKKIYKQLDCIECKNNSDNICGIRYYLAFASIKNEDGTINFAYYFVYDKNVVEKSHQLAQKGDKVISKIYYDDLDEVNKIFQIGQSKDYLLESVKKFEEVQKELNSKKL